MELTKEEQVAIASLIEDVFDEYGYDSDNPTDSDKALQSVYTKITGSVWLEDWIWNGEKLVQFGGEE